MMRGLPSRWPQSHWVTQGGGCSPAQAVESNAAMVNKTEKSNEFFRNSFLPPEVFSIRFTLVGRGALLALSYAQLYKFIKSAMSCRLFP